VDPELKLEGGRHLLKKKKDNTQLKNNEGN